MRFSARAAWSSNTAPPARRSAVSLGILTSGADLPAALRLARAIGPDLGEAIILLDGEGAPAATLPARTRLHARPLAGDFGAQRTALQHLCRTAWILQLDTDETLSPTALRRLPRLVAAADRDGVQALGLPRRNLVDGAPSDHYPDPQYRLCRRTVRYEGQVHERPRLVSPARQSRLALGVAIDHHLTAERVRARTARYGAMSEGATDTARPADERALLTPFRA